MKEAQKRSITKRAARELFNLWRVGYEELVKNADGQCYHVDHGRSGDLVKTDTRWEDPEYGFDENVFLRSRNDYEIVSWSDEKPLDVYDYLIEEGWMERVGSEWKFVPR